MTPSPKTLALRYRIWCFAAAREWDVTIQDIAAALDEPVQRVNTIVRFAGWSNRVRALYGLVNPIGSDVGRIERGIINDVLAGRVNSEFTA